MGRSLVPVWVTVLVTLVGAFTLSLAGGFLGLIPAYMGEQALAYQGLPTGSHWRAFWISFLISLAVGVLFTLLFFGFFFLPFSLFGAS